MVYTYISEGVHYLSSLYLIHLNTVSIITVFTIRQTETVKQEDNSFLFQMYLFTWRYRQCLWLRFITVLVSVRMRCLNYTKDEEHITKQAIEGDDNKTRNSSQTRTVIWRIKIRECTKTVRIYLSIGIKAGMSFVKYKVFRFFFKFWCYNSKHTLLTL